MLYINYNRMITNTSNHGDSIDHLEDRLIAFVDDVCKSRNYHVVEHHEEFLLFPEHTKEDEGHLKSWRVSKYFECNCTQSNYVEECVHVEAVQAAIQGDYEAKDQTVAIAEGRRRHGLTWVQLTDEEVNLSSHRDEEQVVAVNQIGDRLVLYESDNEFRVRFQSESGYSATSCPLRLLDTGSDVLTGFTDSSETSKRQEIINHVKDVVIRDHT